jgi:hypothetical protein
MQAKYLESSPGNNIWIHQFPNIYGRHPIALDC